MSKDTIRSEAISLTEAPATVLLPAQALADLLHEVRSLRSEFDSLDTDLKRFKVFRKTGQVDDLFEGLSAIEGRLAKLDGLLLLRNNEAMTFSEIGKILELGSRSEGQNTRRQAMTRFSKTLDPKNYEVFPSSTQGGKMVKLTRDYLNHLRMEAMKV